MADSTQYVDTNQFWNLLSESNLIEPLRFQTLFADFQNQVSASGQAATGHETTPHPAKVNDGSDVEFNSDHPTVQGQSENNSAAIAAKLIDQKVITAYQSKILLAGHSGPFHFGNYSLLEKIESGSLAGQFTAVHRPTGQPVLLEFFPGNSPEDLPSWNTIESVCQRLSEIRRLTLMPVFEPVVLPHHRMIVSQIPIGRTVAERLPKKARLPWKDACSIGTQIARALDDLHRLGVIHDAVSPRTVWMLRGGAAQLRMDLIPATESEDPPSEPDSDYRSPESLHGAPTAKSDLYSLGCLLVRMMTGKPFLAGFDAAQKQKILTAGKFPSFEKYNFPEPLLLILKNLLAADPDRRLTSAKQASDALDQLLGGPLQPTYPPKLDAAVNSTLRTYRQHLDRWDLEKSAPPPAAEPVQVEPAESRPIHPSELSNAERVARAEQLAQKRKNKRWMFPLTIAASLLLVSGVVGLIALLTSKPVQRSASDGTAQKTERPAEKNMTPKVDPKQKEIEAILSGQQLLVQDLIDDDGSTLWQSPTVGKPVDLAFLPASPKLFFRILPKSFLQQGEASRALRSLGPDFEAWIDQFENNIGFQLPELEVLSISLHSNDDFQYEPFFLVELPQPIPDERLLQIWNGPTAVETDDGQTVYSREDHSFYLIPDSELENATRRFIFGRKQRVNEVVATRGLGVWSGPVGRMANWLDADRHFTMLFLRAGLFNDEGQKMMSQKWANFNRGLSLFLDDNVRGGLVSLHMDDGNYFEFILDRNADLKASELKETVDQRIREQRNELTKLVSAIPPNPYWDRVRLRYDNMLSDVYRNLRVQVEYGQVTGNAWLPPMATHNLMAASELLATYSKGASTNAPAVVRKMPQSVTELLQQKRDLSVTTNPDLNILLSSIRDEVIDDWGQLPFNFEIKIIAKDLAEEGITQNQRPGDFEMSQTTLADILTQIMVRCNPDKNITGPNQPNCKLVWVIADNPERPGERAVLVTTRAAAAQKSYELPPAFKINQP